MARKASHQRGRARPLSVPELLKVNSIFGKARAAHLAGRLPEAERAYRYILSIQPQHADCLHYLGVIAYQHGNYPAAVRQIALALKISPRDTVALNNLGAALLELERLEEALDALNRALSINPNDPKALVNRGVTLARLNRLDASLASFAQAIQLEPTYADAHYNHGMFLLLAGEYIRGWQELEWRWQTGHSRKRDFAQPVWQGSEDLSGKTILLHAEQGFGDAIQFCRYAPMVARRGARVILEVAPALWELMRTLSGISRVVKWGESLPDFDLHCPLMSLPLAFGTTHDSIPTEVPYLAVPEQADATWKMRLGERTRPRVGLVWSGSQTHTNDQNRSLTLSSLLPLIDEHCTFVSLQFDIRSSDAAVLKEQPNILDFREHLSSFADTAALIQNLDLVISVDTSVAHLTGALGKPVWVLLPLVPDWRWLLHEMESTWYPTARLFRQKRAKSWSDVIADVRSSLRQAFR